MKRNIALQYPQGLLHGQLDRPDAPRGLILVARAHHAAVDAAIAANLAARGYAILAMELLSAREIQFTDATQNVPRLAQRLIDVIELIRNDGDMQDLPLALFANGDLTPAAIRAAAQRDKQVRALVCHGGLIDRAGLQAIELLAAPLQMLFDADDEIGRQAYLRAQPHLSGVHEMQVLAPGEDPAAHAAAWFALRL